MQFKGGTGFFPSSSFLGMAEPVIFLFSQQMSRRSLKEPSLRLLTHLMDENFGAKFSIIFQSASSSTPLGCILFSSMSLPNSRVNLQKLPGVLQSEKQVERFSPPNYSMLCSSVLIVGPASTGGAAGWETILTQLSGILFIEKIVLKLLIFAKILYLSATLTLPQH